MIITHYTVGGYIMMKIAKLIACFIIAYFIHSMFVGLATEMGLDFPTQARIIVAPIIYACLLIIAI